MSTCMIIVTTFEDPEFQFWCVCIANVAWKKRMVEKQLVGSNFSSIFSRLLAAQLPK